MASERAGYDGVSAVSSFEFLNTSSSMNGGGSIQTEPELKTNATQSAISPVTFSNTSITLSCTIPKLDIPSTGFEFHWLYQLLQLERTKSVKLLYLSSASDRLQTILEMYGQRSKGGAFSTLAGGVTIPYVIGYVQSVLIYLLFSY